MKCNHTDATKEAAYRYNGQCPVCQAARIRELEAERDAAYLLLAQAQATLDLYGIKSGKKSLADRIMMLGAERDAAVKRADVITPEQLIPPSA